MKGTSVFLFVIDLLTFAWCKECWSNKHTIFICCNWCYYFVLGCSSFNQIFRTVLRISEYQFFISRVWGNTRYFTLWDETYNLMVEANEILIAIGDKSENRALDKNLFSYTAWLCGNRVAEADECFVGIIKKEKYANIFRESWRSQGLQISIKRRAILFNPIPAILGWSIFSKH